jgi:cytochrome c oxidase cbb3-type subunit 3
MPDIPNHTVVGVATQSLSLLCGAIGSLVLGIADASPQRAEQQVRTALELDSHAERGGKLYAQYCAQCHGAEAHGNLADLVPSLAAQRRAYLVKQLVDFSELEREGRLMHPAISRAAVAHPQDWADIAAYLSALDPAATRETGDGTGVELGEAIYQEQCASCHAEDAQGDEDGFIPSLRDQHYSYLVAQMRKIASWHRLGVEPDLIRFLDSFDTEELTAVADYLSRMSGPVVDRAWMNDDGTVTQ